VGFGILTILLTLWNPNVMGTFLEIDVNIYLLLYACVKVYKKGPWGLCEPTSINAPCIKSMLEHLHP
jgi:hypothetical protein